MSTHQMSLGYGPTSLEFISRPNPVEPHGVLEKHPLNDAPRLDKTSKEEFLRLLLDNDVVRPAKRRSSVEIQPQLALDLPKLPTVRKGTQRPRIPPTLSGLHHPPPDAGLLPSMSVEKPPSLASENIGSQLAPVSEHKAVEDAAGTTVESGEIAVTKSQRSTPKRRHNKWSDDETNCLLQGVAKYGIGQWTKILKSTDYFFQNRTALDLKDRFRVCCPDQYRPSKGSKGAVTPIASANASIDEPDKVSLAKAGVRNKKNDSMTPSQLRQLGIEKPFQRSGRRRRTGYSKDEDEALLRGFEKHGKAWADIRKEEEALRARTATDLRDRFRTRYPDEYTKIGLTLRPEKSPSKKAHSTPTQNNSASEAANKNDPEAFASSAPKADKVPEKENTVPNTQSKPPRKQQQISILETDDVFWGAPFEPDDGDAGLITLDRGILDWAFDITRPAQPTESAPKSTSIDPLATLNLPRPTAPGPSASTGHWNMSVTHVNSSVNALPSLATITDEVWNAGSESELQLELPSLMGDFAGLEGDSRAGGHFMSMEELLS